MCLCSWESSEILILWRCGNCCQDISWWWLIMRVSSTTSLSKRPLSTLALLTFLIAWIKTRNRCLLKFCTFIPSAWNNVYFLNSIQQIYISLSKCDFKGGSVVGINLVFIKFSIIVSSFLVFAESFLMHPCRYNYRF